ncbi:MAG: HlyD family efflux transporter periplasmic adaptor subunit [Rudaea sp.]
MQSANSMHRWMLAIAVILSLAACSKSPPQALGTLEFDRIGLSAPAAERIVAIDVHEGQRVVAGQMLLQLDPTRTQAQLDVAQAQAQQQRDALTELNVGPRSEDIAKARADLAAVEAQERNARTFYARQKKLGSSGVVAQADVDAARAAAGNAQGQVGMARAALDALLHGTRPEQIAQGQAALAAADAQVAAQRVLLEKLSVTAPVAGLVDRIVYKLGDQAPVGAPLAILLTGATPYARIYVPEQQRANLHLGDPIQVFVGGRDKAYTGKLRMIRSEPTFTPYYALIGDDAARLSYLAEVELGDDAHDLPAGLPVRVEFSGSPR